MAPVWVIPVVYVHISIKNHGIKILSSLRVNLQQFHRIKFEGIFTDLNFSHSWFYDTKFFVYWLQFDSLEDGWLTFGDGSACLIFLKSAQHLRPILMIIKTTILLSFTNRRLNRKQFPQKSLIFHHNLPIPFHLTHRPINKHTIPQPIPIQRTWPPDPGQILKLIKYLIILFVDLINSLYIPINLTFSFESRIVLLMCVSIGHDRNLLFLFADDGAWFGFDTVKF